MKPNGPRIIERAKEIAATAQSWADLSNALFDPEQGLVARAYPTRKAREAFINSEDYVKLREILSESMATHGLVEGATPRAARYQSS